MPVILKCVTSAPSTGLRLITRPPVVWVSSSVVASVTEGVSATALIDVDKFELAAIAVTPPLLVVSTLTRVSPPAVVENAPA